MKNIANLQLSEDYVLDPMLAPMIQQLSMDKPSWFFRMEKVRPGYNEGHSGSFCHGTPAPEGKKYIRRIVVMEGNREAGRVWLDREYRRRSDDRYNYVVSSHRIENGRKATKMSTTKLENAIRAAKKYFDPQTTGELLYEVYVNADDNFRRSVQNLGYYIRRDAVFNSNNGVLAQQYLYALFNGKQLDLGHEATLRNLFTSEDYEKRLTEYLLARAMENRPHKFVSVIEGDYCYFTDDTVGVNTLLDRNHAAKQDVTRASFDELPDDWQNKIAVLQLMTDGELVLDTGFRYKEDSFLITLA